MLGFEGGGHHRQDAVNGLWEVSTSTQKHFVCTRLLHYLEAVFIVAVQNTRSHECEDRHDVSEDGLWGQVSETRDEKEGLVESLGIV